MTIREVIQFGVETLRGSSPTPQLDIELLLGYILEKDKEYLFTHPENKITKALLGKFKKILEKRRKGVPIAHLTHLQEFFGINFYVDQDVLIPRPETEEVVEDAVSASKELNTNLFLDVGTGSGCIAIAIASILPDSQVIALEISKKAVRVAKKNIKKQKLEKQIKLLRSDLFSKLPKKYISSPKIIVANLPYIGTNTNNFVSNEVKTYEPAEALFGGEDGLDCYRDLMQQIIDKKLFFQAMFFEIGFSQTEVIEQEVLKFFPQAKVEILKDLAGFPRTVKILS